MDKSNFITLKCEMSKVAQLIEQFPGLLKNFKRESGSLEPKKGDYIDMKIFTDLRSNMMILINYLNFKTVRHGIYLNRVYFVYSQKGLDGIFCIQSKIISEGKE